MSDVLNNTNPNYGTYTSNGKNGVIEAVKNWGGVNRFLKTDIVQLLLRVVKMSGVSETYSFVTSAGIDTYTLPANLGRITLSEAFYDGKLLNTLVVQDWSYNPLTREFKFNIDTYDNVEAVLKYY